MSVALQPPPPPTTSAGGGGGGGGDKDEFLRVVDPEEEEHVIQDWISRSRIYKMTDDAELQERHKNAQQVMEDLLNCEEECDIEGALYSVEEEEVRGRHKVTLGLYDEDEMVHAMAGAEISECGELVVKLLAVNPVEVNRLTSTAALRILSGIRALAEQIEVKLDLEPLKHINKGRFWLTGLALLPSDGGLDGR